MPGSTLLRVLTLLLCPILAFGWNGTGHMTVAYIAYQTLSEPDRKAISAILAQHPDYDKWVRGIPKDQTDLRNMVAFVRAAAWPDDIRSDKRFYDDTAKHPVQTPTPTPAAFPDKTAFPDGTSAIHKNWHFINEPLVGELDALQPGDSQDFRTPPTILTKIVEFRASLALSNGGTPSLVRAYELPWLLHLVGDVHQPLHTVAHMTPNASGHLVGDLGGNSVKLALFQNQTIARPVDNLHSFWDDSLGQQTDFSSIQNLGDALIRSHPQADDPSALVPENWFDESSSRAMEIVYKDLAGAHLDADDHLVIPDGYFDTASALSGDRVATAGYRLAAVLKVIVSK
jgi:hypothetical protein